MTPLPRLTPAQLDRLTADLRDRERRMRDLIRITGLLPLGSTPGLIVFRGPSRVPPIREVEIAFNAKGEP